MPRFVMFWGWLHRCAFIFLYAFTNFWTIFIVIVTFPPLPYQHHSIFTGQWYALWKFYDLPSRYLLGSNESLGKLLSAIHLGSTMLLLLTAFNWRVSHHALWGLNGRMCIMCLVECLEHGKHQCKWALITVWDGLSGPCYGQLSMPVNIIHAVKK